MFRLLTIVMVVAAGAQQALAHGFRITINPDNTFQLATDDPSPGEDPVLGPRLIYKVQTLFGASARSTDHPGFEAAGGFSTGDSIEFDVLSKLWYSPGSGDPVPAATGVDLTITRADLGVGSLTLSGTTGFQSGFLIAEYDGSALGDYEHQLFYELTASPSVPNGAYAVAMRLRGTDASDEPFVPSDVFVAVFNNNLDLTTFNAAAAQLYTVAVPEPSGLLLAAVAGMVLAAVAGRSRRRRC